MNLDNLIREYFIENKYTRLYIRVISSIRNMNIVKIYAALNS